MNSSPDKESVSDPKVELLAAETKYRLLVEQLPAVTYLVQIASSGDVGPSSPTVYISPQIESIMGFLPEEWLASPDHWIEMLHPLDREHVITEIQYSNRTLGNFTLEYRTRRADGRYIWVLNTARYFKSEDGMIYTEGLMFDITERKRQVMLNRFFKESSNRLRGLKDLPAIGSMLREHIGQLMPAANLMLALKDEATGLISFPLIFDEKDPVPKTRTAAHGLIDYVFETGRPLHWGDPAHRAALTKAGHKVKGTPSEDWLGAPLVHDGITIGVLVIKTYTPGSGYIPEDVSLIEQLASHLARALVDLRTREALRLGEEQYRRLYQLLRLMCDNVPDMIWAKDVEHRYLFANRALCNKLLLAKDTEEPLGKTDAYFSERAQTEQPDQPDWHTLDVVCKSSDDQVAETQKEQQFEEHIQVRGKPVVLDVVKAPLINDSGILMGTVGSGRDVTRQRQVEQEMEKVRRMETVGRLAGGVAHDFNNMLQVINGLADMILMEIDADHSLHKDISDIRETGQRAAELTRQLLTFGRRQISQPKALDLNHIIEDTSRMLTRIIGEPVTLELTLASDLPSVRVDLSQMEQVLINLAANARDAMPDGGILRIQTRLRQIATSILESPSVIPGAYVELKVSDTGPGIDQSSRDHIFEPFYSTKETGKGVGLGLSMVYSIIQQSGGYVYLDADQGTGTHFTILFPPADQAAPERTAPDRIEEKKAASNHRLLLVEDEPFVRKLLARFLRDAGYEIVEASSGEEALQKAEAIEYAFDLLVTDVVMPGINGCELASKLKEKRSDLQVLFVSGYALDVLQQRNQSVSAENLLSKPVRRNDLLAAVHRLLA